MTTRALTGLALALLFSAAAFPCAYNVRDVGFVELDDPPYELVLYGDPASPSIESAQTELADLLVDTNVVHRVDMTRDEPGAVLRSPGGLELEMPLDTETAFASLVDSPLRAKLIDEVIARYAVVLVVEGTDEDDNARAVRAANTAVRLTEANMMLLPKAIAKPPLVRVVTFDDRRAEKTLLWGLGVEGDGVYATVLYGRVRRMGPVLADEEIDETRLGKMLSVIGADCECGLDRSWMEGAMPPIRWDRAARDAAADALTFDPENPMVKTEISMTIGKGNRNPIGSDSALSALDRLQNTPMAYTETAVVFDDDEEAEEVSEPAVMGTPVAVNDAETERTLGPCIPFDIMLISGIVLVVLVGSAYVLLRAKLRA